MRLADVVPVLDDRDAREASHGEDVDGGRRQRLERDVGDAALAHAHRDARAHRPGADDERARVRALARGEHAPGERALVRSGDAVLQVDLGRVQPPL